MCIRLKKSFKKNKKGENYKNSEYVLAKRYKSDADLSYKHWETNTETSDMYKLKA